MNIKQAKEYIMQSVQIYLKKDTFGEYRIPVVRQRPIFLLGAPGVGKTAIMEQIAEELNIALVSYSMTHHTRQSALGLPFISHRKYGGEEFDVSEYTMSEIISSIYETMETSGRKEGILFLDEINCVSETLAPSMLQFLQYKIFGRHRVPDGWVVVTAGNPPEYNKSVREFDVVTMDRLKVLDVEPDYKVWREYAQDKGLHNVILNFLSLKKEYFYRIETTVKGRSYVTARGWEDLSEILMMYEEEKLTVDETLVAQYLRNDRIVREFTAYYDLYNKYKRDYQIEDILSGHASDFAFEKASRASFDERLSLLSMLIDRVTQQMKEVMETSDYLAGLMPTLKYLKQLNGDVTELSGIIQSRIDEKTAELLKGQQANAVSSAEKRKYKKSIQFLETVNKQILSSEKTDEGEAFGIIKEKFDADVSKLRKKTDRISCQLHALFAFTNQAFSDGNEMLVLVTELTVNTHSSGFIGRFGSEDYHKYSKELMVTKRQDDMLKEIQELKL